MWAARHEETENQALVRQMQADKEQFLAGVRQKWEKIVALQRMTESVQFFIQIFRQAIKALHTAGPR